MSRRRRRLVRIERLEPRLAFHLGDLDATFGAGGIAQTSAPLSVMTADIPTDFALQSNDGIVQVGEIFASSQRYVGAVRLQANGAVDTTFGDGGRVLWPFGASQPRVAVGASDKIVMAAQKSDFGPAILVAARYDSTGQLDSTFGTSGFAQTVLPDGFLVQDVLIDSQQRIVVVGALFSGEANGYALYDTMVVRLQPGGLPDLSFGGSGFVHFSLNAMRDIGCHVAVQSDGQLIVSGYTDDLSGHRGIFVARLTDAGALDATFATAGALVIPYGAPPSSNGAEDVSVVIQSSGRLILGATRETQPSQSEFTLLAVTSAGTLDPTFGVGGIVTTPIIGLTDLQVRGLVQRPDGKLLAVGQAVTSGLKLLLVQYLDDGTLDSSWRQTGVSTVAGIWNVRGVLIASSGRAVVLSQASDGQGYPDFEVVGLDASGLLDTTFGALGKRQRNFASYSSASGRQVAVQGDGKILAGGQCESSNDLPWCLARYKPDGTLDATFGSSGWATGGVQFSSAPPLMLLDARGRVVLVATHTTGTLHSQRWTPSGQLDPTWGSQGASDIAFGAGSGTVLDAVLQGDGQLLVAALVDAGNSLSQYRVYRLKADGALDLSFGVQGSVALAAPQEIPYPSSRIFLQANGRIIVGADLGIFPTPDYRVSRFTPSGQLDTSWGTSGSTPIDAGRPRFQCVGGTFLAGGDLLLSCPVGLGDVGLVRLNPQGALVASFGNQGVIWNPGVTADYTGDISSLVPLPQGGWAAIGRGMGLTAPDRMQTLVQYFHDDGSLDLGAADGGVRWIATGLAANQPGAAALGLDGGVVVAGTVFEGLDAEFLVARLDGDGQNYRPWHNAANPLNVDGDAANTISPIDVLLIVNELNGPGSRYLAPPPSNTQPYAWLDVDGDGFVSPLDVLIPVNYINQQSGPEGEAAAVDALMAGGNYAESPRWWDGESLNPATTSPRSRIRRAVLNPPPVVRSHLHAAVC